jgi:hypothetical protein
MPSFIQNQKGNLKGLLFLLGIILIISGLWYSQKLVQILQTNLTESVKFRIKVFEKNINDPNTDADQSFLFNEVIQGIDYPIIVTDAEYNPTIWINVSAKLDEKSGKPLNAADSSALAKHLSKIRAENPPIPITADDMVLGYYFYGFSPVIYRLKAFPFIAIGSAIVFILIGYLGFTYIKRSEQRFIWVGMAKETAHQLGTPLSSLAGWIELLKIKPTSRGKIIEEIENDLTRLNKIANRFSKIGSIPELVQASPADIIENVVNYFRKRLPNSQRRVNIETHYESSQSIYVNPELFEWVLENLLKNALDAIENDNGRIRIEVSDLKQVKAVSIDIQDNGKGIAGKQKNNIFKPGYSTKKRGWGLGLSLAKRIIEEYHHGKLFLKETRTGQGTTFRIILKTK